MGPNMATDGPNMIPKMVPKWAHDGSMFGPMGPHWAHNRLIMGPSEPILCPILGPIAATPKGP